MKPANKNVYTELLQKVNLRKPLGIIYGHALICSEILTDFHDFEVLVIDWQAYTIKLNHYQKKVDTFKSKVYSFLVNFNI